MQAKLTFFLAWAALVAGLILPTIAPPVGNVISIALMLLGLFWLRGSPATRDILRQPSVWLSLLAGGVLLIALIPTARAPIDILAIFVLTPLWLAAPHTGLLHRFGARLTPWLIGVLSLIGAAGGAAIAGFDVLVLGLPRGGYSVNNPIHLADLSLMLGFMALVGLLDKRRGNLMFLLGPGFALATIWFSGSRGPLMAFIALLAVGGVTMAWLTLRPKQALALIVLGCLGLGVAGFGISHSGAAGRLGEIVNLNMMLTGNTRDDSTNERLSMYRSAVGAFLASPVYGHGMMDYTTKAAEYAPPGRSYTPSGHLHNDLADFAVIGGSLGLLSYALLLLAPLAGGFAAQGRYRRPAIYLGIVAPTGYFAMGLTNAMFGILAQTTLYAVVLSLIAALAISGREPTS